MGTNQQPELWSRLESTLSHGPRDDYASARASIATIPVFQLMPHYYSLSVGIPQYIGGFCGVEENLNLFDHNVSDHVHSQVVPGMTLPNQERPNVVCP